MLFISHDLAVVRQVVSRAYVMSAGAVVEEGPIDGLLDHPWSTASASAVPVPSVEEVTGYTSVPTPTGPHDQPAADLEGAVREAVATNVRRARLAKGLSRRDTSPS